MGKENIDTNSRVVYANEDGKLKDYEELFIMSRCKSNIISNSTFSWWAAWLNTYEKNSNSSKKMDETTREYHTQ